MEIGEKIKNLRILCDLTQEELADRTELTKGYISQLENGLTSPSIATLIDILSALGTNLKEFFSDADDEKIVFSEDDYFEKDNDNHLITWLVPNAQKNEMEPIRVTLKPHSQTEIDYPHDGQEFGYVIEGEIVLVVGKQTYTLKQGETFYFETDKQHYIMNRSNKSACIIWVSSPPNF